MKNTEPAFRSRSFPGSWYLVLGVSSGLFLQAARSQQLTPHLGYVYPAGGRQGTSFQIVVGGQFLNGAAQAFVSGAGARATLVEYNRPMNQKEFNDLRDELRRLQEKRRASFRRSQSSTNAWTAADEKRVAEIRTRILKNAPNRQGNPAIAETVTLQVTLSTNAEPGEREIRVATGNGLSNPLMFCVGDLPESTRPAGRAPNPDLDRFKRALGLELAGGPATSEMRVTVPCTVNGQIMPGAVDRFRFNARKGQQLVAAASARRLIPYLADAVPGWFQATLTLYDAKGKELAYNDDFRFSPDPVIRFDVPKDGEYVLEIKDAIYRGREDFVYRISVGDLPFLTSLFPLGGRTGATTALELQGWNLPANALTLEAPGSDASTRFVSVTNNGRISNALPFALDTLPECLEKEGNNSLESAQPLTLPMIVNGRIDQPGDTDVFRFAGRAGQEIVAEVVARRLGSPLDSVLSLADAAGAQIALNDDCEDKSCGLNTHHADSYLRARLPREGLYYIYLGDVQHKGGAEYAYRLRLSAPRPDFALRVTPASVSARAAVSAPLTLYALRRDGFTNEITVRLKDAPQGFSLSGARIPAGQDQVRVTLAAPARASTVPLRLELEGQATIEGKEVVREAVPAEDMMQAFAYRHLVPAKELEVVVFSRFPGRSNAKILGTLPVKIPAGGTARVQVAVPSGRLDDRFQLELGEPPEGITMGKVASGDQGTEITFRADAAKARPGLKGNLIVNVLAGRGPVQTKKGKAPMGQRRAVVGSLPAIPFEVVAQ